MTPRVENGRAPAWAFFAFGGYLTWNALWLAGRRLPPSILLAWFGIPCPTTGFTRSMLALARGEFRISLLWNAYSIPLALLLAGSLAYLAQRALVRQELVLPRWVGAAWLIILVEAWLTKFALGPVYW
jgi:hypothetical protein